MAAVYQQQLEDISENLRWTSCSSECNSVAKNLAKTGEKTKIKQAISIFKKALELEPEIDLDPDTETRDTDPKLVANKLAASAKVEEGKNSQNMEK